MIYTLEFLGLLAVALSLAASPWLVNVLGSLFSTHEAPHGPGRATQGHATQGHATQSHATAGFNSAASTDRAEMRDEIRRVTNLLESGRLDPGHSPAAAAASPRVIRLEPRYRPSV